MTEYLEGGVFDWLRERVEEMLWTPAERKPSKGRRGGKHGELAALERGAVEEAMKSFKPTTQTLSHDEYRRLRDQPPEQPKAQMTVDEYNRWRGQQARRGKNPDMPYVHQEYPKMLYHKTREPKVVENAAEHARALHLGYQDKPPA